MYFVRKKLWISIMIAVLLLFCSACQNNVVPDDKKNNAVADGQTVYESSLHEQYLDQLNDIDRITITNGTTGEKTEIEDKQLISLWIQNVHRLPIILNSKEEAGVGYMYGINMYVDDQLAVQFSSSVVNEQAVVDSHALILAIEALIQRSLQEKGE